MEASRVNIHLAVIISTINKEKYPSHTIPKRDLGYVVIRVKRAIGPRKSLGNSPVNAVKKFVEGLLEKNKFMGLAQHKSEG